MTRIDYAGALKGDREYREAAIRADERARTLREVAQFAKEEAAAWRENYVPHQPLHPGRRYWAEALEDLAKTLEGVEPGEILARLATPPSEPEPETTKDDAMENE